MTTVKQTTIDISNSLDNKSINNKKRKRDKYEDSSSDDDSKNELTDLNKKEMDFLMQAKAFEIQDEAFNHAIERTFEKKEKKIKFLNELKIVYSNINNEYDRMEALFPKKKKNHKKYYLGGKDLSKKLEKPRTGNNFMVLKINKKLKLMEESDDDESEEE